MISACPFTQEEKEKLAIDYTPLVKDIAKKIANKLPPIVNVDDLICEGYFGLYRAMERFDKTKASSENDAFLRFAKIKIRGAIIDFIRQFSWGSRGSYIDMQSLDISISNEKSNSDADTPGANLVDKFGEPYYDMNSAQLFEKIICLLEDERVENIIRLRFIYGLTLDEIGNVLNMTEPNVYQLLSNGINKLRFIWETDPSYKDMLFSELN